MKSALMLIGIVLLAHCDSSSSAGGTCPMEAPLDCGNSFCCPTATPYYCPNNGSPKCFPYGPADGPACEGYILCGGGSAGTTGPCAHWSCGGSSQCAQVMGAASGVQCQFAPGQSCQQWCQEYIPGNCSCQ